MTTRTDEEIIARVKKVQQTDAFGFSVGDLVGCLSFERAKEFLKEGTAPEDWADPLPRDTESVKARMLEYMPFAWGKANNNRGISAYRSLCHMSAWLWLLGHDEAADAITEYDLYGKPQLRAICEAFGWDWREWDDGHWTNDECSDGHAAPESVDELPGLERAA